MAQEKTYYKGSLVNFSSSNGYPTFWDGCKNTLVHRDVWLSINGEIPEGYEIHHKDKNICNYDINNLELINIEDHHRKHALENGLGRSNKGKTKEHLSGFCGKRREVIALKDGITKHFTSIYKASQELGISDSDINRILKGKRKTRKGWRFEYAREDV